MIICCPHCKAEKEQEHIERGRHIRCGACRSLFPLDDATVLQDYSAVDGPHPEKIGPYQIERFLGKGSLGRVYKGKHPDLGIPIAVKVLSREYAVNEVFRKRFEKASQICAGIDHPNMVKIFDSGTDKNGWLYLAMEYIAGGTVQDLLDRSGPLSPEKTAEIAIAICSALTAAQRKGIVYRDIRPDNIMVTSDGKYKLVNPGLAKYCPEEEEPNAAKRNSSDNKEDTLELISLGTPEYMAPEQSIDANHCDIRADIYSLGVSMYQMLSGHLPFETDDRNELRRRHFEVEPRIPSVHRPEISFDMEYIVMLCLRKKKTERYQTPEELLTDLDAYMDGLPLPSANDPALSCGGRSYGFYTAARKDILVRNKRAPFLNYFRLIEISAIIILTFATAWLLLERSRDGAGRHVTQQASPHLVINRADVWESIRKKAEEAVRIKRGFADAILNLKSFENDANPQRRKEAERLLKKLQAVSDVEVRKMMERLDKEARPYCEERDYLSALLVYERENNPLFKESRAERSERIAKIHKALAAFSKEQKKNWEYLEKFVIPYLASCNYAKAMELYKSPDNPGKDPAVMAILRECMRVPDIFAEAHRKQINMDCKYIFRTEPFDSWSRQGNMKIMRVDPPHVYLHGHEEKPFTIFDLTVDEQEDAINSIIKISEPALALWQIGVNCYTAPEKAEKYVGQLPFSLRESYMTYLKNRIMSRLIQAFHKDLRSLLSDVGYSSNDLPEPEQLPDLAVFSTVEPELYILRIDSMLKTYEALPVEERAYLDALRNVRTKMENWLNSQRPFILQDREFNLLLQENR